MRVLVTGAGGFVGRHVVRELASHKHEPLAFDLDASRTCPEAASNYFGDLQNAGALETLVADLRPDACIHLGGIAFVPKGWEAPQLTMSVNTLGTVHVLESFRRQMPEARILAVTSARVYGRAARAAAIKETDFLDPADVYSVSKAAADQVALMYAAQYEMHTMTARPHNHIGPGQAGDFAVTSFAAQLKAIRDGAQQPVLSVGNLDSLCDFTDVRDVAVAYRKLIERGKAGRAYNIATGHLTKIGAVLEALCALAGVQPRIEVDPAKFRPTTAFPLLDVSRIRQDTGWRPRIPLRQTLSDVLSAL